MTLPPEVTARTPEKIAAQPLHPAMHTALGALFALLALTHAFAIVRGPDDDLDFVRWSTILLATPLAIAHFAIARRSSKKAKDHARR
jgi:hypothetical protein